MKSNRKGSVFLVALTCLVVLFILGFSLTYFTSTEDYLSSMSYESEVAFNLAESSIEEFLARLKNSLNHDDHNNQLYKVLRAYDLDVSKEIPLDDTQVAKLTVYTREMARQLYGFQFGNGLVESEDFNVSAVLRLKHINAVEATNGDAVIYTLKKDKKEKQGELEVIAKVKFRGHTAKVTLCFLIRVVKTFFPPFNAFTLYVKDASSINGSDFNCQKSSGGLQAQLANHGTDKVKGLLRLDNGWKALKPKFDAYEAEGIRYWEKALGEENQSPPGRVYLGIDPITIANAPEAPQAGVSIRSTNGAKLLNLRSSPQTGKKIFVNGQENMFLRPDVDWTGLRKYFKTYMEDQGQNAQGHSFLFIKWDKLSNDTEIRIFNVGAGEELYARPMNSPGPPAFANCFLSYQKYTKELPSSKAQTEGDKLVLERLLPPLDASGLDIFGNAPLSQVSEVANPDSPNINTGRLSPTLVYGPVYRKYFRASLLRPKGGKSEETFELPFIRPYSDALVQTFRSANSINEKTVLSASQACELFKLCGVEESFIEEKIAPQWDSLPKDVKALKYYSNFMSDEAAEVYNHGLINFIKNWRICHKGDEISKDYDGPLAVIAEHFLETFPKNNGKYPYKLPKEEPHKLQRYLESGPMTDLFDGSMWYALPDSSTVYLLDFYFIPRSTEDFFRGRTTVAAGGVVHDRFMYKYINNDDHTLELNGILALNDSEPLGLHNLKFRGHGIIYSSPMMGGGKVAIGGNLIGVDTDTNSFDYSVPDNMLTIIAPQIVIDTSYAESSPCYVEANLISVTEPLIIKGSKPIVIKGTVATPFLNLKEHLDVPGESVIIYNPLNGIWRSLMPEKTDTLYVAKIVTGGVGKFSWRYDRE